LAQSKNLFIVLFFVSMGTLIKHWSPPHGHTANRSSARNRYLRKFVGCWAGARLSGQEMKHLVGLSMLPRGEFSFIVAQEGTGLGVAAQILYPVAGLATLISSVLSSIGLRLFKPRTTPDAPKIKISQRVRHLVRLRNTARDKS